MSILIGILAFASMGALAAVVVLRAAGAEPRQMRTARIVAYALLVPFVLAMLDRLRDFS